jgi:hypothetical protein
MTTITIMKLATTMVATIAISAGSIAADHDTCAAILRDGVHKEASSNKTIIIENTAKRYICTHRGQDVSDAKALELGFMIRFFGARIGVSKARVNAWIDSNCSDNSTYEKSTSSESTHMRSADKALADAWLRCKTLEFKRSGVGITDEVPAVDRSGRRYRFRIAILGIAYNWDKSSTNVIMQDRRVIDIQAQLRSRDWLDALASAKDVFAVGTASCGGGREKEIERALARANRLRDWIDAAYIPLGGQPVRGTINLGKFNDEYCAEGSPVSNMQRPVVVLLVTERPNQMLRAIDYHSALMDAAAAHPAFQFERYSNFDIALR